MSFKLHIIDKCDVVGTRVAWQVEKVQNEWKG